MARKFLYVMSSFVVLLLGGAVALVLWSESLTKLAFVPTAKFIPQPALAARVYDDPAMWIARPGLGAKDPSRWLPPEQTPAVKPLPAAVFFVHPTSYLERAAWNAPLEDADSRKLAQIFVQGMASPFNASPDLWAPRYRQAAFGAFLTDDPQGKQALDAAYGDILRAFDTFLDGNGKKEKIAALTAEVGTGRVVLLGFRPQWRGQSHGTYKFFFNALYVRE